MSQKQYIKAIEQIKFGFELAKACHNINRCKQILCNYERHTAWLCLQDMIKEYWVQIEQLNGTPIIRTTLYQMRDENIREQIVDIANHIPIYLLMCKFKEEMNKRVLENS